MNVQQPVTAGKWNFFIDRGGTFTDVVNRDPEGNLHSIKMLSENPEQYPDAVVAGMLKLLGLPAGTTLTPDLVECVRMGTTVATNALLERKGEPTLYVTTKGFEDVLRIGYQNRPDIFAREIVLPELLYKDVVGVEERVLADGTVHHPLNVQAVRHALKMHYDLGLRSVAINLMHAYRYPEHEKIIGEIARETGFTQISISHQVMPVEKFVARGDTTLVDAYLSPILRRYVEQVREQMPGVPILFMKSNGGLTDADSFQGKDALLSGPAGGIIGMVRTALAAGCKNIIGFDMGGTSTDVSNYSGEFEKQFETKVAGVRVCTPMLSIHTVAAGGGSLLHFSNGRMTVGPDSAGANPGPACYRRGGALTVTDCNVMLGRIQPDYFPHVFGPEADQPLDYEIVSQKFTALADEISAETGKMVTAREVAEGFLTVAVNSMANAIKVVSTQKGHDVTKDYTLATFGGAGGQHACKVADSLGIDRIFIHPLSGVLSAYGMGLADQTATRMQTITEPLTERGLERAFAVIEDLKELACAELSGKNSSPDHIQSSAKVHLKYQGSSSQIEVPATTLEEITSVFEIAHRRQFSYDRSGQPIIIQAVSVEAVSPGQLNLEHQSDVRVRTSPLSPSAQIDFVSAGTLCSGAPLYSREELFPGDQIPGPAVIIDQNATTVIELGWCAEFSPQDHLLLTRSQPRQTQIALGTGRDAVMLEIFNNLYMYTAELMGLQLQLTAASTNIRDRLDFSCAIFDASGNLVANAPHIPVHLGSMGESIRTVIRDNSASMQDGDVFMLNNPYNGGTHLPDITVVTPVFDLQGERVLFYVASRGHHADVGGLTPGSMAPDSRSVEEEGVLINNVQIVRDGVFLEEEVRHLFASAPYPARNIPENIADLQAQVAANQRGTVILRELTEQYGIEVVHAYMEHVQDNAEESVRSAIENLHNGEFDLPLDNGARIKVKITIDRQERSATIDFTGTSSQLESNFNAPRSITTAAVLYVFRTLVDSKIPLNAGCLRPLKVIVPKGSMLNPDYPAAVVAGNVETSSCITNALYGALGIMASAPSTMSNLTFGDEKSQYYETLAGGSAAGDGFHGTSVVQTNMTNSLITDPEVLERNFDVVLLEHSIRKGSGGSGKWHGGDGAIRRLMFLSNYTASILSNNRMVPPFGMAGGEPGKVGRNSAIRNGTLEQLLPCDSKAMEPGDVLVIETPGGGGFGSD